MNDNGTMSRMPYHYFSIRTRKSRRRSAVAFRSFKPLLDKWFALRVSYVPLNGASGIMVLDSVMYI